MTDKDYVLLGRIGAYKMHSLYDARETTKAARAAFNTLFANCIGFASPGPDVWARRSNVEIV